MFRLTRASLWSRKRRLVGGCAAIVIGIGFLAATLIIGDTIRASYDALLTRANRGSDVIVRNRSEIGSGDVRQRGTLPASVATTLRDTPDAAAVVPLIEGTAQVMGANGKPVGGEGPPTVAVNWVDDPTMNGYVLVDGAAPTADDDMVIDRASANTGHFKVGDTATLLTPTPKQMHIAGIVTFGDEENLANSTFVGLTYATAERLFVEPGQVTSIAVRAGPGISQTALRDEIATRLSPQAQALTGAELTQEQKDQIGADFLDFFEMFLVAFAAIALLVATFSIHNTFSILVAQRTRESALLRALGASRRQVVLSIAIEALVLGVVASAVALGVGLVLAIGFAALMSVAGIGLPESASFALSPATIIISMSVGVAVTLLASTMPAVKAGRVAPIAALRDLAVDRSGTSWLRALLGVVVMGAGVTTVVLATSSSKGAVARAGLGGVATLIGMVVLGPVVARIATGVMGAPLALLRGSSGSLARRNAMRNPKRSANTASALLIGTAVVALFASVGASMKATFDDVISTAFTGELVVEQAAFSGAPLEPTLARTIQDLPEVHAATGIADAPVLLDGHQSLPTAADPVALAAVAELDVVQGSLAGMHANGLAVSRREALAQGWQIGTTLPVSFADGATSEVVVEAIFAERFAFGDLIMNRALWDAHRGAGGDVAVLIDLEPGIGIGAGKRAVEAVTTAHSAPKPMDGKEFVASQSAQIDQMLGVVYGMLALALLIAVLGIANTLSLSMHERTRELGLLRAVGQSRRQVRATVRGESVILAVFGALGGLGLGTFLGWGLMRAIAAQEEMGRYELPTSTLAIVVVSAVAVGVLAARRPAKRAAKLDILHALAT
jgi:putative ABC transport system permease protein